MNVLVTELGGDDFRDQLFDLPAGGAVADRDHVQIVLADHLRQLRAAGRFLLVAADDVNHVVIEQRAEFVEHRQLAAVLVAGIDRQHALAMQRRLQQQIPQVAAKHLDGVRLGLFGQLAASLALQAGQQQPRERIAHAADQEILVRMVLAEPSAR